MNINLSAIEEKVLLNSLIDSRIYLENKINKYEENYLLDNIDYWKERSLECQKELDSLVILTNKLIYGINE